MSIIERNFVQDNGTVKENNYKTKYYVRGDDTSNYRRVGDIPVSGNYELNLPYPLDSRMLVPKEKYLTSVEWWRTAFGIDTIIYKGMLVTCIETHKTYVYDGPTVKLAAETPDLNIANWKKQRIDKSLVKWPIDENDQEIIRIGADIINPCDTNEEDDGLYITKNSDLLGAALYINDKFISIGKNDTMSNEDTNIYPFIPYDIVNALNPNFSEITFGETYTNTQTGIFVPTDNTLQKPLSIYSTKGIKLINTDDNNKIILNSAGVIDISAAGDINIKLIEDFAIATENNVILNASSNIKEIADNEIEIRANTKNVYIKDNMTLEASTYFADTSAFKLVSDSDISIFGNNINVDATGKLNLKYGSNAIISSGDSNGLIDLSTGINIKAPNDINLNSNNSSIIVAVKKGNLNIDSSYYINKTKKFEVKSQTFGFNFNEDSAAYAKIYGNYKNEANLYFETKFNNSTANITLNNNSIDITAGGSLDENATKINLTSSQDIIISSYDNNVFAADDTSIAIGPGTNDVSVKINGYIFPIPTAEEKENECILRLKKNSNTLQWSKDIGVKHTNGSVELKKYAKLAEINWQVRTNAQTGVAEYVDGQETLILCVSQSKFTEDAAINTQIYEILITKIGDSITSTVKSLTDFKNSTKSEIVIKKKNNQGCDLEIWVTANCDELSWNGLVYSQNCKITETIGLNETVNNPSGTNISISKNILPIFDTTSDNGSLSTTGFLIPNTGNITTGKSGFLKYTRIGSGSDTTG